MVAGIFNQPNYLAAKKALDAAALKHEAIANNIANVETPGYRRLDLDPSFQSQLQRACGAGDAPGLAALRPALAPDITARAQGPDGNTVCLERELAEMNQNSLVHTLETQLVTSALMKLRLAITGRPA